MDNQIKFRIIFTSSDQILGKILDIFVYLNILRYFVCLDILGLDQTRSKPNPIRNQTEPEQKKINYLIGSNYIRLKPTCIRQDPKQTRTDKFQLPFCILIYKTFSVSGAALVGST